MIRMKKLLLIAGIALLVTSCNNKKTDTSTSSDSGSSSNTSLPVRETELIPYEDEVKLLFDHGTIGESRYYNYCPSVFIENNKEYIYYCTNKVEGNVTDYIGYREGVLANNTVKFNDLDFILEHGNLSQNAWDSRHVCDPSVIKGEFKFHGENYSYLMAYLGCISSNCTLNETGIAVSKTPNGPWIKCDFKTDGTTPINPIVSCEQYSITGNLWGTGQPSLVSIDKKGKVLLMATIGASNGTYTIAREYDFSNIDEYQMIREKKVLTAGIRAFQTGADFICNADFAYDEANRRVLMVKGRQPFGRDQKAPNIVADTLDVYYIDDTEGTNLGDVLFAGNNTTKQWKLIDSIDQSKTGFLRNHNAGLITDEYGHYIPNGRIGVAFSRSDEGQSSNWSYLCTYRIYETAVAYK